jgi:hypothetical protein
MFAKTVPSWVQPCGQPLGTCRGYVRWACASSRWSRRLTGQKPPAYRVQVRQVPQPRSAGATAPTVREPTVRAGRHDAPINCSTLLASTSARLEPQAVPIPGSRSPVVPTAQEYRGEAHLPAEQPEAAQEAWVPAAHAHPRRPFDPQCPPWQGSQPARCLTESGRSCSPPPCACVRRQNSPRPWRMVSDAPLPRSWCTCGCRRPH